MSEAINLMLVQVKLRKALPFEVYIPNQPNAETIKAIEEARAGIGVEKYDNVDSLFKEMGTENKHKHKE